MKLLVYICSPWQYLYICRPFWKLLGSCVLKAFVSWLLVNIKQLLDEVFVISRIIKVEIGVISRTPSVMGSHVMYDCGAWFLRVSCQVGVLCVACWYVYFYMFRNKLPVQLTVATFSFFVQCVTKQSSDSVFIYICRIINVLVRVIRLSWRLRQINPTLTLIILDITKTASNNCLLKCQILNKLLLIDNMTLTYTSFGGTSSQHDKGCWFLQIHFRLH